MQPPQSQSQPPQPTLDEYQQHQLQHHAQHLDNHAEQHHTQHAARRPTAAAAAAAAAAASYDAPTSHSHPHSQLQHQHQHQHQYQTTSHAHAHAHPHAHPHPHAHSHPAHVLPMQHPPPALPRRRGPTACACSLACLFCCGLLGFAGMIAAEIPYVAYETTSMLQQRRVHAVRAGAGDGAKGGAVTMVFGLWDEHLAITPLQLTVALSMSLEVKEANIHVASSGDSFFDVEIEGEGDWLVDAVNGAMFLPALNGQASVFGAKLVVAHAAAVAPASSSHVARRRNASAADLTGAGRG